jgi:hypothetical protein
LALCFFGPLRREAGGAISKGGLFNVSRKETKDQRSKEKEIER